VLFEERLRVAQATLERAENEIAQWTLALARLKSEWPPFTFTGTLGDAGTLGDTY
jgi:hypothetical protein